MIRLGASRKMLIKRIADDPLRRDEAGPLHIGAVRKQDENALLADPGQAGDVEELTVHRRLIKLEVARMHQRPGGRMHGKTDGIGNGVRDAERLDVKQADFELVGRR